MGGYQEAIAALLTKYEDDDYPLLWLDSVPYVVRTEVVEDLRGLLAALGAEAETPDDEYQRPETSEECTRMMRHLNGPDSHCMDPAAHERADRLARIAKVYPAAAAEARER